MTEDRSDAACSSVPLEPPVGHKYRLLTRRDLIERDDEFLADDGETWRTDQVHLFVGMQYKPGTFLPARRKLSPNTQVQAAPGSLGVAPGTDS